MSTAHQDFLALVERVRAIAPEGAEWLLNGEKPPGCAFAENGDLGGCMWWSRTPQGREYWAAIERQVVELPPIKDIKQQRDVLVAALEQIARLAFEGEVSAKMQAALGDIAKAALAKARP